MLLEEPTEIIIKEWKKIYDKNKDTIKPNKKSAIDIINYLQQNYSSIEIKNSELEKVVSENILLLE